MGTTLSDAFGLFKGRRKAIDDAVNGTPSAPAPAPAPVAATPPPKPAAPRTDTDDLLERMSKKYGVPMKRGGIVGKAGKRGC